MTMVHASLFGWRGTAAIVDLVLVRGGPRRGTAAAKVTEHKDLLADPHMAFVELVR